MKNKSVAIEIQQTIDCVEKIKPIKPSNAYFDKIKEKLDAAQNIDRSLDIQK